MGHKNNSFKNFHLKNEDGSYKPAYMCPGIFENDSRGVKDEEIMKIMQNFKSVFLYFARNSDNLHEKVYFAIILIIYALNIK